MLKNSFFRTLACILLFSFTVSLMPTPVFAENDALSAGSVHAFNAIDGKANLSYQPDLSSDYDARDQNEIIVVAQNTAEQPAASSTEKVKNRNCCGDFWDIHFGGYRWVWWALAGAGLIAIHAN